MQEIFALILILLVCWKQIRIHAPKIHSRNIHANSKATTKENKTKKKKKSIQIRRRQQHFVGKMLNLNFKRKTKIGQQKLKKNTENYTCYAVMYYHCASTKPHRGHSILLSIQYTKRRIICG